MAMAGCPGLRLCVVLQGEYVNQGCENSVKSIAESTAKAIDRSLRDAKPFASSMSAE
jgi:hypothetical protein